MFSHEVVHTIILNDRKTVDLLIQYNPKIYAPQNHDNVEWCKRGKYTK